METAHYRVSSRSYHSMGRKTFVGRVHYYEPWGYGLSKTYLSPNDKKHPAEYKRFLYSESTGIHRTRAEDAQHDAMLIGRERTGRDNADNRKE